MPKDDKKLLDYFIEHTDRRFDEMHEKLDKMVRYGAVAVLFCMALSPVGGKILDMAPHLFEVVTAMAEGK